MSVPISIPIASLAAIFGRLAGRRNVNKDPVSAAFSRLIRSGEPGRVFTRDDFWYLSRIHQLIEELAHIPELREVLGGADAPSDVRSALDLLDSSLNKAIRNPDDFAQADERQRSDDLFDRLVTSRFPSRSGARARYFVHLTPPDPQDALAGIAMFDARRRPEPGEIQRRTGTSVDGGSYEATRSISPDGITKIERWRYDEGGDLISHQITIFEGDPGKPDYSGVTIAEYYCKGYATQEVRTWDSSGSMLIKEFWKPEGENNWRPGSPPQDLAKMPLDEVRGGAPHYLLRLKDGQYASCTWANPVTGVAVCTVLDREHINVEADGTPVIDGTDMLIDLYDLVVNPDVIAPRMRGEPDPERLRGGVGPGGRPWDPDSPS